MILSEAQLQRWSGVLFACLPATFFVFIATRPDYANDVAIGAGAWFLFIVVAGLVINYQAYETMRELLGFCLVPTAFMLLFWYALPLLQYADKPFDGGLATLKQVLFVVLFTSTPTALVTPFALAGATLGHGAVLRRSIGRDADAVAMARIEAWTKAAGGLVVAVWGIAQHIIGSLDHLCK